VRTIQKREYAHEKASRYFSCFELNACSASQPSDPGFNWAGFAGFVTVVLEGLTDSIDRNRAGGQSYQAPAQNVVAPTYCYQTSAGQDGQSWGIGEKMFT
jgi:hypothetical protein